MHHRGHEHHEQHHESHERREHNEFHERRHENWGNNNGNNIFGAGAALLLAEEVAEEVQELTYGLGNQSSYQTAPYIDPVEQQRLAILEQQELQLQQQQQAILQEQERERQIQWQQQQAALAQQQAIEDERHRQEQAQLAEQRRIQREAEHERHLQEQARQAEQRRLQQEQELAEQKRLAEEQRIAEEQRLAALKIQEEQDEQNRIATFNAHQALITAANHLSFLELEQQINSLGVLTNPHPRFAESQKNGLPNEGGLTLFFNILINPSLASGQKFTLVQKLLAQKGYAPYLNIIFSTPVVELLLGDLDPTALLEPLYLEAVFQYQMNILPQLEAQFWPLLFRDPLFGSRMFSSLISTGHHGAKALQFLESWRFYCNLPDLPSLQQFYSNLLRAYKAQLTPELHLGIQASFMALTQQNWPEFYTVLRNSEPTPERLMQFFEHWLLAPYLPVNQDIPVHAYHDFISSQAIKTESPGEAQVWETLIRRNVNGGFNLFNFLLSQSSHTDKLFSFIDCWLGQLNRDTEVIQAYKLIKPNLAQTNLQDCKAEIRKMYELRLQELRNENKGIENPKTTEKWIKKNHPGFFSCTSSAAAPSSFAVYDMMDKEPVQARRALQEEKEAAAENINQKLTEKGEAAQFKFRR